MSSPLLGLNNGVEIPAIGFGVFQTPPDETIAAVSTALEVGYRHVDTAAADGSEREVGEAIRRSGLNRSEVFVETKVWISDYGYESLVTRAMELSPANPSFIDERNAILLADTAVFHRADHDAIWRVFAKRGMGFFAGSLGGNDTSPGADFHVPPGAPATGAIAGTATHTDSGAPVAGATVALAFQGAPGSANPVTTTRADGPYSLGPVPVGAYPKLSVLAPGFDPLRSTVTVTAGGVVKDLSVRRDWAAQAGGGAIPDFNGPDFGPQCGPEGAIDGSQGTGWGTTTGDDLGTPTNVFVPKHIVIQLPQAVDVSEFAVDPSATCGDGGSASTGGFTIETSPDGVTFTEAANGTFTIDDRGRLNSVLPTAGTAGVRFVRFTITSNQTPNFPTNCPGGNFSGCSFTDLTEIEVYGAPSP